MYTTIGAACCNCCLKYSTTGNCSAHTALAGTQCETAGSAVMYSIIGATPFNSVEARCDLHCKPHLCSVHGYRWRHAHGGSHFHLTRLWLQTTSAAHSTTRRSTAQYPCAPILPRTAVAICPSLYNGAGALTDSPCASSGSASVFAPRRNCGTDISAFSCTSSSNLLIMSAPQVVRTAAGATNARQRDYLPLLTVRRAPPVRAAIHVPLLPSSQPLPDSACVRSVRSVHVTLEFVLQLPASRT